MPYAFKHRSRELRRVESIDILDVLGSSIRIDTQHNNVVRVVPYLDEFVNDE
jgi:NADH-quinone oxidoreductase subunit G